MRSNQVKSYTPDKRVNLVISSSKAENKNILEKEEFDRLIKKAAMGLFKNYKNESKTIIKNTNDFKVKIAKNFDGRTFSLFLKHLEELKTEVLDSQKQVTVDSFLVFLDKLRNLTHSKELNEVILDKLAQVNIDLLRTKSLLNSFQKHSAEFKFEEKVRMGEIKKFAQDVIPKSKFIFDRY